MAKRVPADGVCSPNFQWRFWVSYRASGCSVSILFIRIPFWSKFLGKFWMLFRLVFFYFFSILSFFLLNFIFQHPSVLVKGREISETISIFARSWKKNQITFSPFFNLMRNDEGQWFGSFSLKMGLKWKYHLRFLNIYLSICWLQIRTDRLVWTILDLCGQYLAKLDPTPRYIFKHRWLWTLETFIKKSVRDFVCSEKKSR